MRARCPQHGLIKRKGAKHCPACGEDLLCISLFPLFKIYLSRGVAFLLVSPLLFFGFCWTFNVSGCIAGCNARLAAETAQRQAHKAEVLAAMPDFWRQKYWALGSLSRTRERLNAFYVEMKDKEHVYPVLGGEQIRLFLSLFGTMHDDDSYSVLMRVMKEPKYDSE